MKVGRRQQFSGSFRHGPKYCLSGISFADFFDLKRARLVPNKSAVTLGASKKSVEHGRISTLSSLSFLYKRTNILTQCPRRTQKRLPRWSATKLRYRKSRLFE